MKILFVCSGNSKEFGISPFIQAQGKSLEKQGADVFYCSENPGQIGQRYHVAAGDQNQQPILG